MRHYSIWRGSKKEHNISDYDNYGMFVSDYYVDEFVIEFLYKYFDLSVQDKDYDRDVFDGYGGNLYSRESMEKYLLSLYTFFQNELYRKNIDLEIDL